MRANVLVIVLSIAACNERGRPAPAPAPERPATTTIALDPKIQALAAPIDPTETDKAAIHVAMHWLESVRYGVPAHDSVLELPLVSVVPRCAGDAPCARKRIEALMSIDPQLIPNIVAPDLISHYYHSSEFGRLGSATHVNVSVFGDLGRLGFESADITFAVLPDESGTLAIRGIEIVVLPKT